jgi:hypothetical protein
VEEHLLACDLCAGIAIYVEAAVRLCRGALADADVLKN